MGAECVKETGSAPDIVKQLMDGTIKEDKNCFSLCFFRKANFLGDDGKVMLDKVRAEVPLSEPEDQRAKSKTAIEACKDVQGKDECDYSFQIHKCYFNKFLH